MKHILEYFLARKFMFNFKISRLGSNKVNRLTRAEMQKELITYYGNKYCKKKTLVELLYIYIGVVSGGTEIYDSHTGKSIYVGIAS